MKQTRTYTYKKVNIKDGKVKLTTSDAFDDDHLKHELHRSRGAAFVGSANIDATNEYAQQGEVAAAAKDGVELVTEAVVAKEDDILHRSTKKVKEGPEVFAPGISASFIDKLLHPVGSGEKVMNMGDDVNRKVIGEVPKEKGGFGNDG
ncbi:hypothetical protein JHK87_024476 [Glycine soja]|nr:hypothetical protein JHK87_024476 [Glycine soja]